MLLAKLPIKTLRRVQSGETRKEGNAKVVAGNVPHPLVVIVCLLVKA